MSVNQVEIAIKYKVACARVTSVAVNINDEEAVTLDRHISIDAGGLQRSGRKISRDGRQPCPKAHLRRIGAAECTRRCRTGAQALRDFCFECDPTLLVGRGVHVGDIVAAYRQEFGIRGNTGQAAE